MTDSLTNLSLTHINPRVARDFEWLYDNTPAMVAEALVLETDSRDSDDDAYLIATATSEGDDGIMITVEWWSQNYDGITVEVEITCGADELINPATLTDIKDFGALLESAYDALIGGPVGDAS